MRRPGISGPPSGPGFFPTARTRRCGAGSSTGFWDASPSGPAKRPATATWRALKAYNAKLAPPAAADLVEFFQKRTRSPEELARIQSWLGDLGNVDFRIREVATRQLSQHGPLVLPFLRYYETNSDPEVLRRATLIHDRIRNGPGPELTIAAIRQFAESSTPPAEALAVLLAFAPFADNDMAADETYAAIAVEAIRMGGSQTAIETLQQATRDGQPGRRAAAAWVLGILGTGEQIAAVRTLRTDADALVRLRAAQGLVAAGDRDSVGALIEMLPTIAGTLSTSVEETLQTLAGDHVPTIATTDDSAAGRVKLRDAWKGWWTKNRDKVDMSLLRRGLAYQGLITICEYDGGIPGRGTGRVWQRGRDGRISRWAGRRLPAAPCTPRPCRAIASGSPRTGPTWTSVVEKDFQGKNVTVWEVPDADEPDRVPAAGERQHLHRHVQPGDGDHAGQEAGLSHERGPRLPPLLPPSGPATLARSMCMTAQGDLLELRTGSTAQGDPLRFRAVQAGGWCSAQALPNGRYLIATMSINGGQVCEVDDKGAKHWSANYRRARFRATYRLPTGNTVVVEHVDAKGGRARSWRGTHPLGDDLHRPALERCRKCGKSRTAIVDRCAGSESEPTQSSTNLISANADRLGRPVRRRVRAVGRARRAVADRTVW